MPPYNFPSSEELLRQLFGNYQSQQTEPRSATDITNEATVAGLQQKINEQQQAQMQAQQQAQAQAQQQALDPIARKYYVPQLLDAKKLYESASNPDVQSKLGMNQEQIRQQAHNTADRWRQAASDAGFDLSGYGSDVSLQDAYQNLQTNDARAVVDLAQGEYALTSDQYYTRRYAELRKEGYGHLDSKNRAGAAARKYQGERVSYLNGMLNGYGFDGRVMTPIGLQIVAQLATEKPEIANMYLNATPGQKEAFTADNQMAQAVLNNQDATARLERTLASQMEQLNRGGEITRENATHQAALQEQSAANAAQRAADLEEQTFNRQVDRIDKYLPEKERPLAMAALFKYLKAGSGTTQSGNNDASKDFLTSLDKTMEEIRKQRDSLINQYKNDLTGMDGAPQEVLDKIAELETDWQAAKELKMGIQGVQKDGVPKSTGKISNDSAALMAIWERAEHDETAFRDMVSRWLDASGVSGVSKTTYLGALELPASK